MIDHTTQAGQCVHVEMKRMTEVTSTRLAGGSCPELLSRSIPARLAVISKDIFLYLLLAYSPQCRGV